MSAWGVKLYQNDIAKDIKHMYKEYLRNGKTNEEATQELILKFEGVLEDIEDGANFWLALADQQWQLGKLMPYVKEQALNQIQNGADLRIWYETSTELGNERKKVLEELSIKLNSLQPPEKKISKRRYYKCPWKVGDVFAVEMNTAYAKEQGLYGKYMIFQIKDTGAGMSGEQMKAIWEKADARKYASQRIGGYAIKNVKERLELIYHEDYELHIESRIGQGTVVDISVPCGLKEIRKHEYQVIDCG